MRGDLLQGAGLGLMIWLGWLIPFHRLPLPEGYAPMALSLALLSCVAGVSLQRHTRIAWATLVSLLPASALLAVQAGWIGTAQQRWLGPSMMALAAVALLRIVRSDRMPQRLALTVQYLAAGCVLAVSLLMAFLPIARLRMPLLTVIVMLLVAAITRWASTRGRR